MADAVDGFSDLELMARARHVARALRRHLPADYEEAVRILTESLGPPLPGDDLGGMEAFLYAPHVLFVGDFGLDHWEASMQAQYELTQRFSAEFSIRGYIEREPERTLERLRAWAADPSPHVRRLVSEGTRPRLPWAPRLRRLQRDPAPVLELLELLELLRDDPSLYVRRSVANNLTDIGKDHPDLLVETCRRWALDASAEREWLIRHALRSELKRGERGALEVLGFASGLETEILSAVIAPGRPRIGENVRIAVTVRNAGSVSARVNVDLRILFVKANGRRSGKVFRMGAARLDPDATVELAKVVSLRQASTRTHYPGEHLVEAVINGAPHPIGSFMLE